MKWIEELVGEKLDNGLEASLKDGIILCKLANAIKPGSVKNISTKKMPTMQRENINAYLTACKDLGLQKHDLFVTNDLFEGKNIPVVVDNLYSLGSLCMTMKNFKGPVIGTKRSEKTEYNFTEEQLNSAKNQPTLISEGSRGCSSQAGMRDTSHDVIKTTDTGIRGEVSKFNEGSKGCSSQSGSFDTSKNIIKTTDTGVRGEVSKFNEGSKGCSSQSGSFDTSKNIIKVQSSTTTTKKEDDPYELIEKLAELKTSGIITEEEFTAKKKILGL